jgi:hypothetical protein
MSTRTITATDLDVRVRERNLKTGLITEKDVEKHLASLPDLESHVEGFSIPQPALDAPAPAADEADLGAPESDA